MFNILLHVYHVYPPMITMAMAGLGNLPAFHLCP